MEPQANFQSKNQANFFSIELGPSRPYMAGHPTTIAERNLEKFTVVVMSYRRPVLLRRLLVGLNGLDRLDRVCLVHRFLWLLKVGTLIQVAISGFKYCIWQANTPVTRVGRSIQISRLKSTTL